MQDFQVISEQIKAGLQTAKKKEGERETCTIHGQAAGCWKKLTT